MSDHIISLSILIAVILLVRALFGRFMGQRFQYMLWLIVAIKLLVPMPFANPVSVVNLMPENTHMTQQTAFSDERIQIGHTEQADDPAAGNTGNSMTKNTFRSETGKGSILSPSADNASGQTSFERILPEPDIFTILRILWITGIILCGGTLLVSNLLFSVRLKKQRFGIEKFRSLPVYQTSLIQSPCLFGLVRPAVYLPADFEIAGEYREYVLLHEWVHARHRDTIWSLVRCICLTIYWFHPLVWLACVLSARDSETACDEGVIARIGEGHRREYGQMLVQLCAFMSGKGRRHYLLMSELKGGYREMRQRLSLLVGKTSRITGVVILAAMIAALAACGTFGGGAGSDGGSDIVQSSESAGKVNESAGGKNAQKKDPQREDSGERKETKIPVTAANPDLSASVGEAGAFLYYADEREIIFGGSFGLYVFDPKEKTMLCTLDLEPIGCSATEGASRCEPRVSADGNTVYLHPADSRDMYVYEIGEDYLTQKPYDLTNTALYTPPQPEDDVVSTDQKTEWLSSGAVDYRTENGPVTVWLSHANTEIGQLGYEISQISSVAPQPEGRFFLSRKYNTAPVFAASDIHDLQKAEMLIRGKLYSCKSKEALDWLEEKIGQAESIEGIPGCPFEDAIYLTGKDGRMGVIYPATDACAIVHTGDGYLDLGEKDNSRMWELLGWNPKELW